jgi:hypothetical protein
MNSPSLGKISSKRFCIDFLLYEYCIDIKELKLKSFMSISSYKAFLAKAKSGYLENLFSFFYDFAMISLTLE